MAMDLSFTALACCLLALSFNVTKAENQTSTPPTTSSLNLTEVTTTLTSSNSTSPVTITSNLTEETTQYTSTKLDNETFTNTTAATTKSTSHHQTSQSGTILTPLTNSTTPTTQTPAFTAPTTAAVQTTAGHLSTAGTPVITTENSSHAFSTTLHSVNRTTQGLGLNMSEKNMTIVFSVVFGAFAMSLVFFMFQKCKQKLQYLHQPLNNGDDTDPFVAEDDTLIISGGLYDGHPIYDNIPTAPADQSQLRLEFLH